MKRINGIIYALLSSTAFGFMPIFAKVAYNHGSNCFSVLTFRFLIAALILFVYFMIKKIDFKINKKQLNEVFLIGSIGYTSTGIGLFLSYKYISVGLATTMHFVYPAAVILMSYILYKDNFTKNKVLALIFSLAGVYVLAGKAGQCINPLGVSLAILSGLTYAACIIAMNKEEIKELDNTVVVFYFSLFSGITLLIFSLLTKNFVVTFDLYANVSILGISVISTIAATVLFIKALKIIGASSTSILATCEPIVSIIMGILLFKEKLTSAIIFGTILILLSVIILAKEKNSPEVQVEAS
ncbi:DMT family transporter [Clostridium novyi]|uniref:Integral membrane protein, putative n=1 Tax=Clostridium novyi (strain NT) TaxID=386415 RepID=A0Q2C5_CLONN|nr:DMT family transporter [Clostridium novyi]ABK62370.1 Integral membrane protein, putative [Clostridium novyi NT]KEH85864.1 membrane protein [Clostridium novyi A str. NCTC 538]